MSNALTIAAVTATLKDILESGLAKDAIATSAGDVLVTALPPDRITVGSDERPQLNIFLYQVSQNRNVDWTGRSKSGKSSSQQPHLPPLALDLHYLLAAYGAKDFQAELLLGYVIELLHGLPAIPYDLVHGALDRAATAGGFGVLSQALAGSSPSELAACIGNIKLCPEFFGMEETSKLWSSLQTHYRPSAAYKASMVTLGDSSVAAETAQPSPRQPVISSLRTPTGSEPRLSPGETLVICGQQFSGVVQVRFSGRARLCIPETVEPTLIAVKLPSDLPAGIHGVQVACQTLDRPLSPSQELFSNVAAFVLQPAFDAAMEASRTRPLRSPILTVWVNPRVGKGQAAIALLFPEAQAPTPVRSIIFPPRENDTETLEAVVRDIEPGKYKLQLQIDGAQPALDFEDLPVIEIRAEEVDRGNYAGLAGVQRTLP